MGIILLISGQWDGLWRRKKGASNNYQHSLSRRRRELKWNTRFIALSRCIQVRERRLTNLSIAQVLVDSALVFAMSRVKVVLDTIVGAPRKIFCDIGPLISKPLVQVENPLFLVFVYRSLVNIRVQMVVPSEKIWVRITRSLRMINGFRTSHGIVCRCEFEFWIWLQVCSQQRSTSWFRIISLVPQ